MSLRENKAVRPGETGKRGGRTSPAHLVSGGRGVLRLCVSGPASIYLDLREPAIRGADGYVEDEEKGLVEGRVGAAGAAPGIDRHGAVDGRAGELAVRPQVFVLGEVEEDDLLEI